ncbi:hypothetical protein QF026_008142 [Streptomyces aurantiacus]|uniref:PepSY domain-containing protein n=1 Tax=Streptomyces aurantiacus TaxID=47760 RepID=UPI00278F76DA|nr:PepSY domain-containing protein [Streptomyces aurantiacus]MDQ0779676.1 hypothetical protein [Streptomyces aurantiacus]
MKRISLVLLTSGALVAAITGTALAGGSDDTSPPRSASSASASSVPSPGMPTASSSAPSSGSPSQSPTTVPTADDTAGPAGSASTAPASRSVGGRRAGELALSHVGGGTLAEVEAETEHGRAVWSVKIVKDGVRYEVHVDRGSGAITRSRTKADDDHGGHHAEDRDGDDGRHGRHHG